jgi:hypothetical protein
VVSEEKYLSLGQQADMGMLYNVKLQKHTITLCSNSLAIFSRKIAGLPAYGSYPASHPSPCSHFLGLLGLKAFSTHAISLLAL